MHESRKAEAARSGTSKGSSLGRARNETEEETWATAVEKPERRGEAHALNAVGAGKYPKCEHYLTEGTG